MTSPLRRLAIAAMLAAPLAGCPDERAAQGGGGGMAGQPAMQDTYDLDQEGRAFAEAYARMPWVHANIAAGDWERALADLQFVTRRLEALDGDPDVAAALKTKLMAIRPELATLGRQIQAHDMTANHTAATVTTRFATLVNDPLMNAWLDDGLQGGGGGR